MHEMENSVSLWKKYYRLNNYYHSYIHRLALHLIPEDSSVVEFSCKCGELLSRLPNKDKVGVEFNDTFIQFVRTRNKWTQIFGEKEFFKKNKRKFDYILLSHTLSDTQDVQTLVKKLMGLSHDRSRVVVFYFNYLWKPILDLAEKIGLKLPNRREPNWLSEEDIDNFFYLESFEKVKTGRRFIFPYKLPIISEFINRYISPLPFLNSFCLINYSIYRPLREKRSFSVSIVIPARNEEGNMRGIFEKIPKFGKRMQIIFVEGHSKDKTYQTIQEEIKKYRGPIKIYLFKQKGKGKGDAVRLGFSKARNELLMILDADLTVEPKELPKFYKVATGGKGELIMGSRLIYPMEKLAMRTLNILGNKFFSVAFTFLLDQKIKDTLCGTKVILREDYKKIEKNRKLFGNFDPFGDFDLIFGAAKLNLKIIEIPIRYKERSYGFTNISRFIHGVLLARMAMFAAFRLKFI